jgi:hypothetical protein
MGGLIPNPNDLEVIDALNTRFSGTRLQKLRDHIRDKTDDFFEPGRRLKRISWRLKVFPSSGIRPKGRWLTFLGSILPSNIHDRILNELRDAVGRPGALNDKCAGVRFWAAYDPNLAQAYDLTVDPGTPDGNGFFWKTITLKCRAEIPANESGDPQDPPKDNGEKGPDHPNLASSRRRPRGTTKQYGTKTAVKRTTKAAKKKRPITRAKKR